MARDHRLVTAIFSIAMRILFAWQRCQARRAGHSRAKTAGVLFVQRFGGALNCNVHAHTLLPDGVFVLDTSGAARSGTRAARPRRTDSDVFTFVPLPPPENEDIATSASGR